MTRPQALKSWIAVGGVLLAYWLLTATTSPQVGATFDEPGHITSGYAYWKFGDFRINAENGMLGTRAAAAPLLDLDLKFPSRESPDWRQPNTRALAGSFFFDSGNDQEAMLRRARAVTALFGVVLLALVWAWARRLFGVVGGAVAAGLAALSPTLLAHGGLATSDVVLSCCLLAAVSAFWRLWHVVTWPRLVLAGLAAGATFLAKVSGVLLVPMLIVLLIVRCLRGTPLLVRFGHQTRRINARASVITRLVGVSAATAVVAIGVIWAGYHFRFAAAPDATDRSLDFDPTWQTLLEGDARGASPGATAASMIESGFKTKAPGPIAQTISWCRQHQLLPESYLWSIAFTFQASRARPSFFWGESSTAGSHWFFPAAFFLKSTPPELALFAVGIAAMAALGGFRPTPARREAHIRRRFALLYRAAPLIVMFVVYSAVAINTPLNIGHRHLLPIYPVVFVFAGAAALWLRIRGRLVVAGLLVALGGWQAVESFSIRPFYVSYFTPFVGSRGWHYLVDSSFDWGQGLPALKSWIDEKRNARDATPIFLSYFGSDSPRARGLPVIRVADWRDDSGPRNYPAPLRGGWYAISATNFQRVYLGVDGPWSERYEQRYQEIARSLPKDEAGAARLTETQRAEWMRNAMLFEILQFGRVCHFLRDRAPLKIVGSSILIFRLTDEEVSEALTASLVSGASAINARPPGSRAP